MNILSTRILKEIVLGTQFGRLLMGEVQFSAWPARLCFSTFVGDDSQPPPERIHQAADDSCCNASRSCCVTATCELVTTCTTCEAFRS